MNLKVNPIDPHQPIRDRWPIGKRVIYMQWDSRAREHTEHIGVVQGYCLVVIGGWAQFRITVKLEGYPRTRNVSTFALRDPGPFNVRRAS